MADRATIAAQFPSLYTVDQETGCWLWTRGKTYAAGANSRPTVQVDGRPVSAYRLSYELHIGPIPPGALICHHCDTPVCVNPAHLYSGNHGTNARDAVARQRTWVAKNPERAARNARNLGRSNTWSRGCRKAKTLIPHADLPTIHADRARGVSLGTIAGRYGVSKQAVRMAILRDLARIEGAST